MSQAISVPPALAPGDAIGIVAPSSPFDRKAFERGLVLLEQMGFRPILAPDLFARQGYLAGRDHQRAEQLMGMFADPGTKALICARGGYGAMRMLPHLDFDLIRRHPKMFVGFSDATALLNVLYRRCGMVVYHGPTVVQLGDAHTETRTILARILSSRQPITLRPKTGVTLRSGATRAPVMGGNLTTLCHLVGTAFSPRFQNHILFLEERGEALYRIDRMLTQMRLAGCFEGMQGLVLGSFSECGEAADLHRLFLEVFNDTQFPILSGMDAGHGPLNQTLPVGQTALLDAQAQLLRYGVAEGGCHG